MRARELVASSGAVPRRHPNDEITELNIPTATPLVYEFDDAQEPIAAGRVAPLQGRYLGDQAAIRARIEASGVTGRPPVACVLRQGGAPPPSVHPLAGVALWSASPRATCKIRSCSGARRRRPVMASGTDATRTGAI